MCDSRHIELKDWYSLHTLEIRDTIFRSCQLRNDEWCLEVAGRLEPCNDLVAK